RRDAKSSPGEPLMRHARSGKKLGRDSSHRKALYANRAGALIEHGRIKTTEAKAKAVKPFAEQMITLGKGGDLHSRRLALAERRADARGLPCRDARACRASVTGRRASAFRRRRTALCRPPRRLHAYRQARTEER